MTTLTLDIETTGLDVNKDRILCVGIKNGNSETEVFGLDDFLHHTIYPPDMVIGHNVGFDLKFLNKAGTYFTGKLFDTKIASQYVNPNESHRLKDLAEKYLGEQDVMRRKTLIGSGKTKRRMEDIPFEELAEYCKQDVDLTYKLYSLWKDIPNFFLHEVELRLIPAVIAMELSGFKVDSDKISKLKFELDHSKLWIEMRHPINLNSPKQLREYLINKGYSKELSNYVTSGQVPSTNKLALKSIVKRVPIAKEILKYREVAKLLSTYVTPMSSTDIWQGSFNQVGTKTGRFSSSKPNLQNIPARTELGKRVRECLLPVVGNKFIVSDLSQIEPRLYAFFSQDKQLLDVFRTNNDFHSRVTESIYKTKAFTKEQRFVGKTVGLATLYGASVSKLKETLLQYDVDVSWSEITRIKNSILQGFPDALVWSRKYEKDTERLGKVVTLLKREILYYSGMNCTNTLIQGSCADILKVCLLNLYLAGFNIIATVHDEVVISYDESTQPDAVGEVQSIMQRSTRLEGVPILADTKVCLNWGQK